MFENLLKSIYLAAWRAKDLLTESINLRRDTVKINNNSDVNLKLLLYINARDKCKNGQNVLYFDHQIVVIKWSRFSTFYFMTLSFQKQSSTAVVMSDSNILTDVHLSELIRWTSRWNQGLASLNTVALQRTSTQRGLQFTNILTCKQVYLEWWFHSFTLKLRKRTCKKITKFQCLALRLYLFCFMHNPSDRVNTHKSEQLHFDDLNGKSSHVS